MQCVRFQPKLESTLSLPMNVKSALLSAFITLHRNSFQIHSYVVMLSHDILLSKIHVMFAGVRLPLQNAERSSVCECKRNEGSSWSTQSGASHGIDRGAKAPITW